jgi:hypothetical protein
MGEKYSEPDEVAAEATFDAAVVQALLGRLAPSADAALLLRGLLAESAEAGVSSASLRLDAEGSMEGRELARVRRQLRAGEVVQSVHLAMGNTLTALQTEAQLLELEPLADQHRQASARIVELARRLATVLRRLDSAAGSG